MINENSNLFEPIEVKQSMERLNKLLYEDYGKNPITYKGDKVGSLVLNQKELIISYRGSISRPLEIISLVCSLKKKINDYQIEGYVHGNIYYKFEQIKSHLWSHLNCLLSEKKIKIEEVEKITIEGYSQGSLFATLTAAFLSDLISIHHLRVITFAPLGIFDDVAQKSYNEKLKGRHLSFIAKEDKLINFNSLLKPGHVIKFSICHENEFNQRLQKPTWTYLAKGCQLIFSFFIRKKTWEAHMPQTYQTCYKILKSRFIN